MEKPPAMLVTSCPSCKNQLEIESKYAGKSVLCPYCQQLFVPPRPNSGFGVAALSLAGLAAVIELFALVYFATGAGWQMGYLSAERVRVIMVFVRFSGLLVSWSGIGCAVLGLMRKRRSKFAAKWGLIINLGLNFLVCGFLMVSPFLPKSEPPAPAPAPAPVESEATE
jgi:hypothetical protein